MVSNLSGLRGIMEWKSTQKSKRKLNQPLGTPEKSQDSQAFPSEDHALWCFRTSALALLSLSSSMRKDVVLGTLSVQRDERTFKRWVWYKVHSPPISVSTAFYSKTFNIFNWTDCCPEFPASQNSMQWGLSVYHSWAMFALLPVAAEM